MDFSKIKGKIFFVDKFINSKSAKIHVLNHSIHFATSVFEGIRVYNGKPLFLDEHQNKTLIVISDIIIPATDTPGAKEAKVNRFLDFLLNAEDIEIQRNFVQALSWFDSYSLQVYNLPFVKLSTADQTRLLTQLSSSSPDLTLAAGVGHFQLLKDLITRTFYSSEIGYKELGYQSNPYQGEFPGCPNPDEHKL